jgi:hypothetical protein
MPDLYPLINRLQSDHEFLLEFRSDPARAIADYDLTEDERTALTEPSASWRRSIEMANLSSRDLAGIEVAADPHPFPVPFDPSWPPAPPPQPPSIPTIQPPPINDYRVTVRIWPLGTARGPDDLEHILEAQVELVRSNAGVERRAAIHRATTLPLWTSTSSGSASPGFGT